MGILMMPVWVVPVWRLYTICDSQPQTWFRSPSGGRGGVLDLLYLASKVLHT